MSSVFLKISYWGCNRMLWKAFLLLIDSGKSHKNYKKLVRPQYGSRKLVIDQTEQLLDLIRLWLQTFFWWWYIIFNRVFHLRIVVKKGAITMALLKRKLIGNLIQYASWEVFYAESSHERNKIRIFTDVPLGIYD